MTEHSTIPPSLKKHRSKVHLTIFWQLFLGLLLMILMTSTLSIVGERWLNEQELESRMDHQIKKLLSKREQLVAALELGDIDTVKQLYEDDRRLMNQIRIYDQQGAIIFPRYRHRQSRRNDSQISNPSNLSNPSNSSNLPVQSEGRRVHSVFANKGSDDRMGKNPYDIYSLSKHYSNDKTSLFDKILQPIPPHKAIADVDSRPELAEVTVVMPNAQTAIIQVRPYLLFKDVLDLQRGNFTLRLALILLFSVLVCFWLSRTMTKRILQVQHTIHRMLVGDYQANPDVSKLGKDELGLLAHDVAQLSSRLADSELARKQMLSDISHELRSPLARLDVATELTRDFAPNASRYLDRIDKESARMNELIEQIIHIQSLQMQQYRAIEGDRERVNIAEIISEIGQDVCFEFQHKNVHWQWQPPTSTYEVCGNQEQLHSALENIIRNAFMHTPPNSTVIAELKKIQMNHTQSSNTGDGIQIHISDEGGGVDDKDLERIFQPFVRLDSARHRQTGGYGLGLAIVHAVVMAHQGQLKGYNRQQSSNRDGRTIAQGLVVEMTLPLG